jgi:hypothetical protein
MGFVPFKALLLWSHYIGALRPLLPLLRLQSAIPAARPCAGRRRA